MSTIIEKLLHNDTSATRLHKKLLTRTLAWTAHWESKPMNEYVRIQEFVVVVSVANNNSHNYTMRQPILVTNTQAVSFYAPWGGSNSLDLKKSAIRPATSDEITKLVEKMLE